MPYALAKGVASRCLALCSTSGLRPTQHIWVQASKHVSMSQSALESASQRRGQQQQQPWVRKLSWPSEPRASNTNTNTTAVLHPFTYKKSQKPAPIISLRISAHSLRRGSPSSAIAKPTIPATTMPAEPAFVRTGSPSYNFTVTDPALQARFGCSMQAFLDRNRNLNLGRTTQQPQPEFLATGAVVFNASRTAVLLVQRSASDSMPGLWETPGGGVDADDATVLHAVSRELWEEAGLRAAAVRCAVPCRRPRSEDDDDGLTQVFLTRRGRVVAKYSFVVEVEDDGAVVLDPGEHQAFVWATEEECVRGVKGGMQLPITTREQREVILQAWRIMKGLEG